MAHITGGGLPGNLNRALPPTLDALVNVDSWTVPNVFKQLAQAGRVEEPEMFRTFNMGVGMVVIAPPNSVDAVIASVTAAGVRGWTIGRVSAGSGRVVLNEGD
jgi:phosphoribosylformylglycinamidine cyclo-ligase